MPTPEQMASLIEKIKFRLSDVVSFKDRDSSSVPETEIFTLLLKKGKGKVGKGATPTITVARSELVNILFIMNPTAMPEGYFQVSEGTADPVKGTYPMKLTKLGFLDENGGITDIKGEAYIRDTPASKGAPAYTYTSYSFKTYSCDGTFSIISHLAHAYSSA